MTAKYPRLSDEEWLRKKYHNEGMSLNEIAKAVGCSSNRTVQRNMEKLGIDRRGTIQRNDLGRSLKSSEIAVLEGELLGDGCLFKLKPRSDAYLEWGLGDEDHRDWLSNVIGGMGFTTKTSHRNVDDGTGNGHEAYRLRTHTYPELTQLYERWYIGPHENDHQGTKRVPPDVQIAPETLLHWHLGDGFISDGSVLIATTRPEGDVGFTEKCRRRLLQALKHDAGVDAHLKPSTGDVFIPRDQEDKYYDYMVSPPKGLKTRRFK